MVSIGVRWEWLFVVDRRTVIKEGYVFFLEFGDKWFYRVEGDCEVGICRWEVYFRLFSFNDKSFYEREVGGGCDRGSIGWYDEFLVKEYRRFLEFGKGKEYFF